MQSMYTREGPRLVRIVLNTRNGCVRIRTYDKALIEVGKRILSIDPSTMKMAAMHVLVHISKTLLLLVIVSGRALRYTCRKKGLIQLRCTHIISAILYRGKMSNVDLHGHKFLYWVVKEICNNIVVLLPDSKSRPGAICLDLSIRRSST